MPALSRDCSQKTFSIAQALRSSTYLHVFAMGMSAFCSILLLLGLVCNSSEARMRFCRRQKTRRARRFAHAKPRFQTIPTERRFRYSDTEEYSPIPLKTYTGRRFRKADASRKASKRYTQSAAEAPSKNMYPKSKNTSESQNRAGLPPFKNSAAKPRISSRATVPASGNWSTETAATTRIST